MTRRIIIAGLLWLALPATSHASVTPLWLTAQLQSRQTPTPAQAGQFTVASGWRWQQTTGPRWYTYVKGSRSYDRHYPEAWYLHQDGARVRDKRFGSFVMDPRNHGWQQTVLAACPRRCFLDGLGTTSLDRTQPHLQWTDAQWVAAVDQELRYLVSHDTRVIPNSIGAHSAADYLAITGRASTEAFNGPDDIGLLRAGKVWVVAKRNCGWMLAAFLMGRGRGDRFSCYEPGTAPWVIPKVMRGAPLGRPLGRAGRTASGYTRRFTHGRVAVNADGTYRITYRRPG